MSGLLFSVHYITTFQIIILIKLCAVLTQLSIFEGTYYNMTSKNTGYNRLDISV